jgi:hypothetical protein
LERVCVYTVTLLFTQAHCCLHSHTATLLRCLRCHIVRHSSTLVQPCTCTHMWSCTTVRVLVRNVYNSTRLHMCTLVLLYTCTHVHMCTGTQAARSGIGYTASITNLRTCTNAHTYQCKTQVDCMQVARQCTCVLVHKNTCGKPAHTHTPRTLERSTWAARTNNNRCKKCGEKGTECGLSA